MATRLDRLVLLLDTGSTPAIRATAAKQLGEVQKQHPLDLYHLLSRVLVHLKSRNWDTRVAAGLALASICENVPQWEPPFGSDKPAINDEPGLAFATFRITQVLDKGQLLVSSAGKEFDADFSNMDPKERLALQKKMIREKLGLETRFMDIDFFEESDIQHQQVIVKEESKISLEEASKANLDKPDPFAGLSARERNQLKRKAKLQGKKGGATPTDVSSSSALKKRKTDEAGGNIVVVEHKDVTQLGVYSSGDEWPFEGLCEQLFLDLFSPRWEARHGAAIGLREIIKSHGGGVGKLIGLDKVTNDQRTQSWLEDAAIRLLCVLTLDRFADFVGDQAVIPVRETCAQTLAVVMKHASPQLCLSVLNEGILVLLRESSSSPNLWAVSHSALVGLKYWMASRIDLLDRVLCIPGSEADSPSYNAIINGLKDTNDDVRATASSALIPISERLVSLLPPIKVFNSLVMCLWSSLHDLDDLTAATSYVMDLLADLVKYESIAKVMQTEAKDFFNKLVPQLFPFVRHAIVSVRRAVLRTISTLVDISGGKTDITWITADLIRLIFQNFVVEGKSTVIKESLALWEKVLHLLRENPQHLRTIGVNLKEHIGHMYALIMSTIGKPIDRRLFVQFSQHGKKPVSKSQAAVEIAPHDVPMIQQDLLVVNRDEIMYGRITGLTALGMLISKLLSFDDAMSALNLTQLTSAYLQSAFAEHRVFSGIIVEECARSMDCEDKTPANATSSFMKQMWDAMVQILNEGSSGACVMYNEILPHFQALYSEAALVHSSLIRLGIAVPKLPSTSIEDSDESNTLGPIFSIDVCEKILKLFPDTIVEEEATTYKSRMISRMTAFTSMQTKWNSQVQMSLASALVAQNDLPGKLNPIIRSLMNSLKTEENEQLQGRAARAIALLLKLNRTSPKGPSVNEKIIKNITVFLCSDSEHVGDINQHAEGILAMVKAMPVQPVKKARNTAKGKKAKQLKALDDVDDHMAENAIEKAAKAEVNEAEKTAQALLHRGSLKAMEHICENFGADVFNDLPKLWEIISEQVIIVGQSYSLHGDVKDRKPVLQALADSLHVLAVVAPNLHIALREKLLDLLDPIVNCLRTEAPLVRHLASKALTSLCLTLGVPAMQVVLNDVMPMTSDGLNDIHRKGGVELIYHLVELMKDDVLPYIVFLIVPLLGRMSDVNPDVRFISTNVFAQLVKLAPLESGIPDPEGFTAEMIEKKRVERKFIGQLIGAEKITELELPVPIKADLRPYQIQGVSWLAFLNRYGLHGILCDDMGLGKTLQSICMMAADHHNRKEDYAKTKSVNSAHCPSLIVCPSTLTGHWFYEIKKFASFLSPVVYSGDKNQRSVIRETIMKHDMVIMSYESLRNDIDDLKRFNFNYVTLDEGHVIKNPSTKLTEAVKTVKGFHRLILSGTPVQNNVLELWSLFDFLMPGFLGTQAQFKEKFGKPIMASRDAKSSSKEQEKGALALEALHKQVLPFLMRRMKEDVLDDLPPKIIQDYYCELNPIQIMLYEDFSHSNVKEEVKGELSDSASGKKGQHIFQALQYLRKLCNHPAFVVTPEHPKHSQVMTLLKKQGKSLDDVENSPKLMALQDLLLSCGIGAPSGTAAVESSTTAPHRVLIFAQVKQMLDMVENQLFKKLMPSVTYMRLESAADGMKRQEMVEKFNSDPSIDVLLMTTHVGGLGLNLTGADTVIFIEHDWNPMKDLQAMDRAHRIGQKRVVNVYRLITKGTLEEKIMGLQKFKLNIASSIINQENSGIESMDTDQIMDLFDLGEEKKSKESSSGKATMKQVLAGLDNLWDESQYENMQKDFFEELK